MMVMFMCSMSLAALAAARCVYFNFGININSEWVQNVHEDYLCWRTTYWRSLFEWCRSEFRTYKCLKNVPIDEEDKIDWNKQLKYIYKYGFSFRILFSSHMDLTTSCKVFGCFYFGKLLLHTHTSFHTRVSNIIRNKDHKYLCMYLIIQAIFDILKHLSLEK